LCPLIFSSAIEGAHHPDSKDRVGMVKKEAADDSSDEIGGSAGQIITALRYKLKEKDKDSNTPKCLICMVSGCHSELCIAECGQ